MKFPNVAFLDSQSALTFNLLGRCSAVIVIWQDSRYFQLDLLIFRSWRLSVPSIFKRYARATFLSTWTWMVKCYKFFVKVSIVNLMSVVLEHLCENASPPLTISPCRNSLALCPQPFVEASVWMIIWGSCCWIFFPIAKFQVFHPPMEFLPC